MNPESYFEKETKQQQKSPRRGSNIAVTPSPITLKGSPSLGPSVPPQKPSKEGDLTKSKIVQKPRLQGWTTEDSPVSGISPVLASLADEDNMEVIKSARSRTVSFEKGGHRACVSAPQGSIFDQLSNATNESSVTKKEKENKNNSNKKTDEDDDEDDDEEEEQQKGKKVVAEGEEEKGNNKNGGNGQNKNEDDNSNDQNDSNQKQNENENENDSRSNKPLRATKASMSKAERRALQEQQRAAKAAAKGGKPITVPTTSAPTAQSTQPSTPQKSNNPTTTTTVAAVTPQSTSNTNTSSISNTNTATNGVSVEKGLEGKSTGEKTKQKQIDNSSSSKGKGKEGTSTGTTSTGTTSKAISSKTTISVEHFRQNQMLFSHLPAHNSMLLPEDMEKKRRKLGTIHPAIIRLGLKYENGIVSGGNHRALALFCALKQIISDYELPPGEQVRHDLLRYLTQQISYLVTCRPLSASMGASIRHIKNIVCSLNATISVTDAKKKLFDELDLYEQEKIIIPRKNIFNLGLTLVKDGDVILVYGSSEMIELVLTKSFQSGKNIRVVVVDSKPDYSGKNMAISLANSGVQVTYIQLHAVCYIIQEVTKTFLSASALLTNGSVYSCAGTSLVAMVSHKFKVPVIVFCEPYKFVDAAKLDAMVMNEIGNPDKLLENTHEFSHTALSDWKSLKNLKLLNLLYDLTPMEFVQMVVTDVGLIPPTSVPVILREYQHA